MLFRYLNATRDALETVCCRQIARSLNTRHEPAAAKFWAAAFGSHCEQLEAVAAFVDEYGPDVLEECGELPTPC